MKIAGGIVFALGFMGLVNGAGAAGGLLFMGIGLFLLNKGGAFDQASSPTPQAPNSNSKPASAATSK